MRKMPRGCFSTAPPSSSGVMSSTCTPSASSPFAVRRRISESSLSRPGECASSRKMPQQYGSVTLSLPSGADKGPSASTQLSSRVGRAAAQLERRPRGQPSLRCAGGEGFRSEERRVGKEGRSGGWPCSYEKKQEEVESDRAKRRGR